MSTKIAVAKPRRSAGRTSVNPAAAATPSAVPTRLAVPLLALGSVALLWASFPPLDLWLLGWIAPVPWLLLVRADPKPQRLYWTCYGAGLVYWLASVQWMRLADPTMNVAWVAFSVYLALSVVALVALCRQAVHRLHIPLMVAAPLTWVGVELLRAHLLSGFAWYFLGHTQYRWLALIQISDLVGAYGVSFLMVLVAALVAEAIPLRWFYRGAPPDAAGPAVRSRAGWKWRIGAASGVMVATLAYGSIRLGQAEFTEGPKVAMIQGNVPLSLKEDPEATREIFDRHVRLTFEASKQQPDLIVWGESMLRTPLVQVPPGVSDARLKKLFAEQDPQALRSAFRSLADDLAALSRHARAAMLIGAPSIDIGPAEMQKYNSAVFVTPGRGIVARYDKAHLVPFGEYLPLADTLPWLVALTPFPPGYGFDAGQGPVVLPSGQHRFGVLICFEDTVPHLVRRYVAAGENGPPGAARPADRGGPVDFLVNVTNDGWFGASSELEQHLITSVFRAVECRTPLVRATNTGISAVIDGDGRIVPESVARDQRTGQTKEIRAVVVDRVPLDSRWSPYVQWGDWFAIICLSVCLAFALAPAWAVVRTRRAGPAG